MKIEMTASQKEAFNNPVVLKKYFQAVKEMTVWEDYRAIKDFKREYPEQFRFYQKVHRLRNEIENDFDAMKMVCDEIYFGTLTFNDDKNENKVETKRKDAFQKLKSIFKYVLLVEEYGGVNGRYHIHFLAAYKKDLDFQSFKTLWHSRQHIEKVADNGGVGRYLVSYVVKDLPRLRRNRELSWLRKKYTKYKQVLFLHNYRSVDFEKVADEVRFIEDFDSWVENTFVKVVAK